MLDNGDDPSERRPTRRSTRPIGRDPEGRRRRARSVASRGTTTRSPSTKGDLCGRASPGRATSCSCSASNPKLKWVDAGEGRDDLDGQHADPERRQRTDDASTLHELRVRPEDRGPDRCLRQLRLTPVKGAQEDACAKTDPETGERTRSSSRPTKMLSQVQPVRPGDGAQQRGLHHRSWQKVHRGLRTEGDMGFLAPATRRLTPLTSSRSSSRRGRLARDLLRRSRSGSSATSLARSPGIVRRAASRSPGTGLELHGRALDLQRRSSSDRSSTPAIATVLAPADRLPAGLLDRLPRGTLEEPLPVRDRRAVLRHLPDPHAGLAETILADEGFVVGRAARRSGSSATDGRLLATSVAVIAGITYNFLPFMVLPMYVSLEQIDPRLLEAAKDLYASHRRRPSSRVTLPLSAPGHRRRHAADVHPGGGRLHQRPAARHAAAST